jgi:phosphoglycerol transferase MdoB-like AlkP superfamily enzyme
MLTERTIADKFETLLKNLRTQNDDKVKARRRAITKRLNQDFWSSDSETEHSRYIGSYGRGSEIKGATLTCSSGFPIQCTTSTTPTWAMDNLPCSRP